MTLQSVHFVNRENRGDMLSCPFAHFTDEVDVKRFHLYDISGLNVKLPVIIGGGGLLQQGQSVEIIKMILANHEAPVILWGVGVNTNHTKNQDKIDKEIKQASLIGIRDVGFDDFNHVPCVSCLHPSFMKSYEIKHDVVCFEGNKLDLPIPTMGCGEGKTMQEIMEFLGSAKTIVTSSYHGMYWGTLLARKVIVIPNADSSKFYHFPKKLPMADVNTWEQCIGQAKVYPDFLFECVMKNLNFKSKVEDLLNIDLITKTSGL